MRSMVEGGWSEALSPLHRAARDGQVRIAPGNPQPFRGKGGLPIPPRPGEDFSGQSSRH